MVEAMKRYLPIPLAAAALVLILAAIAVAGVTLPGSPSATADAGIEVAVRAAILTDKTIVVMPAEDVPGHVRAETITALKTRLAEELPRVYAGSLLSIRLERLDDYLDAARANPNIGQNTAAGITSLDISRVEKSGGHATVSGSYRIWLTGRHLEGGVVTPDRVEGTYTFEAGFDELDGAWHATSWSDQQLS
jgi:hypothetical protein